MNIDLKSKWLAALRSGEYKQATGALCTADGAYCCLGVLCLVAGAEFKDYKDKNSTIVYKRRPILNGEIMTERLVVDSVGLSDEDEETLINMNDAVEGFKKHDFLSIAAWIEENL